MKTSDVFPSRYLKWQDLNGKEVRVIIKSITIEDLGNDRKPVMFFDGAQKGMIVNKTNWSTIAQAYGDESDAWTGKPVILFAMNTSFQGRPTQGLRVRIPVDQPAGDTPAFAAEPAQPVAAADDLDDSIPF